MDSLKKQARMAGFIYLLLVVGGPVRLVYIPAKLFVAGNAAATAANIAAHETLFRIGIATDCFSGTVLIFLTLALYRLFEGVRQEWGPVKLGALMVVTGGILPAAIDYFNALNDAAALILIRGGADFLAVFSQAQREALAMLFLRLHHQEIVFAEIFWGLWLIPLALLTIRSGFLPRSLGYWLILNGFAYVVLSFTGQFVPDYEQALFNAFLPAMLGELAFMLWLVIMGARRRTAAAAAA
jgi:hypothetical protein